MTTAAHPHATRRVGLPTIAEAFVWLPELGYGYHPAPETPYGADYYDEYVRRSATPMGKALTEARVAMVRRFLPDHARVVDIGIGSGAFVEARGETAGFDVNPVAVHWLNSRGLYVNPYQEPVPHASFWDSLEHIRDADRLLSNVEGFAFVSLPIFQGCEHVLRSRHYKPGEHFWYWTRAGLIRWMEAHGFVCREHNTMESLIGREDIHSFAFQRVE